MAGFIRCNRILFILLPSFFLLPLHVSAQANVTIRASGSTTWSTTLGSANITGPGASFATPVQSVANDYYLRVAGTTAGKYWEVSVQRDHPSTWLDSMRLYVQRNTNDPNLSGGQPFVYIPHTGETYPSVFIRGTMDFNKIDIQLQMDVPPMSGLYVGTFTTTITYTIVDNL